MQTRLMLLHLCWQPLPGLDMHGILREIRGLTSSIKLVQAQTTVDHLSNQ